MPKLSAGLLVFRIAADGIVEVLIVHPGGPFWAKKDLGSWSVPKGEYVEGDDPLATAEREFNEELGSAPPVGERLELGELRQPSGKRVHVWAVQGDLDSTKITSNTFDIEWPPRSGRTSTFPEVDRAVWATVDDARHRLARGQVEFLDLLMQTLVDSGSGPLSEGGGIASEAVRETPP